MEVVRHHRVVMEYAVPPTLKHATAVLMIVGRAPPVETVSAQGRRTAPRVLMIAGYAHKNPPAVMDSAMAQKTVAHVLETAVVPVHSPPVPKDKAWMVTETACRPLQIVRRRCLEEYGTVQNVVAQMEPC